MKLTKKAVLAANDDIQGKIGFKPALDTKLKTDELNQELYKKVLEVQIDDDDREDLDDSTCAVIDALAEKYPNIQLNKKGEAVVVEAEEAVVEDAEIVEEEKSTPKKKAPKKEAMKPAPKKKAVKGKKIDPLVLAEEIKTNKTIKRDGLYEIVNNNADLFGEAAETLLSITNPMVLKKQMRNVLEGGKVEMTKTKAPTRKPKAVKEEAAPTKEKKEKKAKKVKKEVEPTLREIVESADDLDALKAIAKANKDLFPGVKAKKFDKLKKLRKALLEVIVEKKKKAKPTVSREESNARRDAVIKFVTKFINDAGGSVGRKKLTAKAIQKFPDDEKRVRDTISYGKNPKYNKFAKLLVEVDGVIGWEGKVKPAKKSKKAEAPKEEIAPTKEKKEKKGKKDKKGKKSKK